MEDKDRKILTEYLGLCWHEAFWHDIRGITCVKCDAGLNGIFDLRRTFTTTTDLHAVYSRMVKNEDWDEFVHVAEIKYIESGYNYSWIEFIAWLSCYGCELEIPVRMVMAAEFVEGRK